MAKIYYLLVLMGLSHICIGYKILVVFPMPGKSHNILGTGYVKHLLEAGHEVTYITPFPTNKTNAKYHEVDLSGNIEYFNKELQPKLSLKAIIDKETSINPLLILSKFMELYNTTLNNANLLKFLSDTTQEFDVVITEWLFTDIYSAFASLYNCPLIWSSSMEPHWIVLQLLHEPYNPAYNADAFSTSIPPFSFYDRAKNLLGMMLLSVARYTYLAPNEKAIYEEVFAPLFTNRGRELPPYQDVVYNGTFMLTNSHTALSQSISVPPNVKEIGGYHIDPNTKPLPADLKTIMDEAKDGVIYFSMGSNAQSKDWPDYLKIEFLEVFAGLKQTVLWKFEEQLPNLPKNVHILNWAPQQSILAHPNMRLFITHGGLLSTTESVYFGVPTIVIPYGADQLINALRAVNKGYAKLVELSYTMAGEIKAAIEDILANPKYTGKVKELSKLFHDRALPPGKELVHWVEYVVRTRGAPHLRSPALLVPWYQKMYFDLLALVLVGVYVTKLVFKLLYCKGKSLLITLGLLKAPANKNKIN